MFLYAQICCTSASGASQEITGFLKPGQPKLNSAAADSFYWSSCRAINLLLTKEVRNAPNVLTHSVDG
jgi:hypothetical protein